MSVYVAGSEDQGLFTWKMSTCIKIYNVERYAHIFHLAFLSFIVSVPLSYIQTAVFMGCRNGEIEMGWSSGMTQVREQFFLYIHFSDQFKALS